MCFIVFALHLAITLFSFAKMVIPPGNSADAIPSDLLFKKYMLKPDSKLHVLFLRKNKWMNMLHIKQNAAVVISIWAYSIINTVVSVLGLFYGARGKAISGWEIASLSILLIYGLINLIIHTKLKQESKALFFKQCEMSKKEVAALKEEISSMVPGFYDPYKIKGIN